MRFGALLCALVLPLGTVESKAAAAGALSIAKALDYRFFVAGGTCAAISHGITTPIDVVKTRIQDNPRKYNKGMVSTALELMKEEGPMSLLGGLGPTFIGYGIEGAVKFGVYEIMKKVFSELLQKWMGDTSKALAFLLASVVAGAMAALLLCPMESTRIKVVTDKSYKNLGLWSGLSKLSSEEGLGAIFDCLPAMLTKQVPYTFGKQVSFDVFAKILYKVSRDVSDKIVLSESQVKWMVSVLSAFLASLVACAFSQPGDMVLTETYRPAQGKRISDKESRNFANVIGRLYQDGGVPRFFAGTGARIVHVGAIITSQLVIYDVVKQMLGLPATGSH